jgi:hypothetical protein
LDDAGMYQAGKPFVCRRGLWGAISVNLRELILKSGSPNLTQANLAPANDDVIPLIANEVF